MTAALLLARQHWKLAAFGILALLLAASVVRGNHFRNQRDEARINLNECREGRKADRKAYEQAQRDAKAKNDAEVKRIGSEQQRISDNVEADLNARLERLRSELRRKNAAPGGQANRPGAGSNVPSAPGTPKEAGVCISTEQFLLGAEYEEKLDQWITLYNQMMGVKR